MYFSFVGEGNYLIIFSTILIPMRKNSHPYENKFPLG